MTYSHGAVVSIPDPYDRRPSRPVVVISDEQCPDYGDRYTVAALTSSDRYGEHPYAVAIEADEPASGELLTRSFLEPWATHRIAHGDIRAMHARLSAATMKRIATAYAEMVLRG
ncbi:type II toxin-antitoxin system PemK/MazF family toxin [Halonotius roseus]|jgi:mRNA-degrading endonuclease toxin of MazEF toxin-antitoxin module|uniref:Type II toxin-antitoxin system PemK/MazF family toxin n=1 Tax=Halonotius roseus TaxID=2511997 RepID=A0A544QKT3_9EURY|nr:type II toxin-antitoxin system PemK/MazF family toxin [Halonotius roseus]TQQ78980.1 hypothetical protein EWF95_12675 [Halonotius roseus]